MRGAHVRVFAALLALLVLAALGLGARCMSVTEARCSFATLFGGAPRLDVPYAETRAAVVDRMLEISEVGPGDYVIDLGTGDGRILIAAARDRGARGLGVDIDPVLVREAEANARSAGVADRAVFRARDLFETPLGEADVLAMYLLPEVNLRLRPRILAEMRPGARVVSHSFDMGEWRPDASDRVGGSRIHSWIVPARVDGRWTVSGVDVATAELVIEQHFQTFDGSVRHAGGELPVTGGRLRGDRIRFVADFGEGPRDFHGIVRGDRIVSPEGWSATRP